MTRDRMNDAYFNWMVHLVSDMSDNRRRSYRKLFRFLHETEFVYLLDMDANRADDGIDLRYRFAYEHGHNTRMIAEEIDGRPCSVFEMMTALALRCETNIMDDPAIGNRTGKWIGDMLVSLGLSSMDDSHFNEEDADTIITRFLRREYEPNGQGGLFTVPHCPRDLRNAEIWYQMMWYLNDIA